MALTDYLTNLALVEGPMLAIWLWSIRLRDVSIVDIYWGLGFVWLSALLLVMHPAPGAREVLITSAVALWGLRLGLYLYVRNHGAGEDRRYQAIRRKHSPGFWWKSLFIVFLLQGLLISVVSLPVQRALIGPTQSLSAVHLVGSSIFLVGWIFEALADVQLARFKRDPQNRDRVLSRGLWRISRHPNYFGDFLVWWGIFLMCWSNLEALWLAVGPAVMTLLLLKVSGVSLLEKDISQRRPEYADYILRTPAFFPWFPRNR
jgi:steroid 5-alpha reductase family enzyme